MYYTLKVLLLDVLKLRITCVKIEDNMIFSTNTAMFTHYYTVQITVYSVQCTVYIVQCTMYSATTNAPRDIYEHRLV